MMMRQGMKRKLAFRLPPLLILIAVSAFSQLSLSVASAGDGVGAGGGGGGYAGHFAKIGQRIARSMKMICATEPEERACTSLEPFFSAIATTEVIERERVYAHDGHERDATNDGKGQIEIGRLRYEKLLAAQGNAEIIVGLVAHEYLSIALHSANNDQQEEASDLYNLSTRFVTLIVQAGFSMDYIVKRPAAKKPTKKLTFSGKQEYAKQGSAGRLRCTEVAGRLAEQIALGKCLKAGATRCEPGPKILLYKEHFEKHTNCGVEAMVVGYWDP